MNSFHLQCSNIYCFCTCSATTSDPQWKTTPQPVIVHPFTAPSGPATGIAPNLLTIFQLFFTTTLMESIVNQTNLYARQTMNEQEFRSWTQVTTEELWAYLRFSILMAINHLPSLKDYWRTDQVFHYAPVASRISRNWFFEISRYLHFVDNLTLPHRNGPGYHRLQNVQPVIAAIMEACMTNYIPSANISIDEAMIAFKGRASIKQYMPIKAHKKRYQSVDEVRQHEWVC